MNVSRPSIDEAMLDTPAVWARRSTCSRLAVGAVLARDNRVLSTGYNGAPASLPHCSHDDDQPRLITVHAEANALLFAGRHDASTPRRWIRPCTAATPRACPAPGCCSTPG